MECSVIFMTTMGTLVKRYALWKSQRGATLGELEQFNSSTSCVKIKVNLQEAC
jgi:hypothetical protein